MSLFFQLFILSLQAFSNPVCAPEAKNQIDLHAIAQDVFRPFQLMCLDINRIETGKNPEHNPLCSVFWGDRKVAGFEKVLKANPESLNKSSNSFVNLTEQQMTAIGRKKLSSHELAEIQNAFNSYRDRLLPGCCGNDEVCRNAFQQVQLRFCKSPSDPSQVDPCTKQKEAFFSLDRTNQAQKWYNLNAQKIVKSEYDRQMIAFLKYTKLDLLFKLRPSIANGIITLSEYTNIENSQTSYFLQHEFGHACSSIRRQISAINSKVERDDGSSDSKGLSSYCGQMKKGDGNITTIEIFEEKAASDKIKKCINERVTREIFDSQDRAFAPNSCYGSKIEEANADLFAALSSVDGAQNTVYYHCNNYPDAQHIAGFSIVECLIPYSANYRQKIKESFNCKK
jgi:hypothetical protein